jgi:hypothetical protein
MREEPPYLLITPNQIQTIKRENNAILSKILYAAGNRWPLGSQKPTAEKILAQYLRF